MEEQEHMAHTGPLSGLTVVELGDGTAAPYAAKLFGDLGADVFKIEGPDGDSTRQRGPFPDGQPDPESSGLFLYLNVNKFGVMLDLANGEDRRMLHRLLGRADIFMTSRAAGDLEKAGFSPRELRKKYPKLIVTTISPFGADGPWAQRHGDELTVYAASGLAYSTPGMPDAADDLYREPPLHPTCFAAETIAGLIAATGTMSSMLGRGRTGEGCHVEVSEHAAVSALQIRDLMNSSYGGTVYNRLLNPTTIGRMPNFYLPCKDGYVTVAAPMDIHWQRLVEAMGNPPWAVSDRFATSAARTENWIELRQSLISWTITLAGDELHAIAEKSQLPIFPFYSIRKMADSGQSRERRTLVSVDIGGRRAAMPGAPFSMRATPWSMRRPAPRLGEHTDLVLGGELVAAS